MTDKIIDFNKAKLIEPKPREQEPIEGSNLYIFHLKDGTEHEHEGQLITTPAFFACGVPLVNGQGVDFSFAVPIEYVHYVERVADDDLLED